MKPADDVTQVTRIYFGTVVVARERVVIRPKGEHPMATLASVDENRKCLVHLAETLQHLAATKWFRHALRSTRLDASERGAVKEGSCRRFDL